MAATNKKFRIQRGDLVTIIAGKQRGATGRVLKVLPEKSKVIVEGVRVVKRHQRPVGEQPGGIVEKEAAIDISNVALWNAEDGRRVKVAYEICDGKKVRVDRITRNVIES